MNITPAKQKILRAITRSQRTFREMSTKRWTICPAERQITPPAIYLEGDLERITAVMEDTSYEQEMMRIRGGNVEHAPTVAYELTGCEILDGSLYKNALRVPLTKQPAGWVTGGVDEKIRQASLASTYYGSFYFGHWITDDLTLQIAAEEIGSPIIVARNKYGHEDGYCELLGVHRKLVQRVRLERLVMFDDFGQNSYKRRRYGDLRSRLSCMKPRPGSKIYIRRGTQGANRALTNSAEVENCLIGQGFEVIEPESLSPRKIVEAVSGASLVVGVEGSHMIHSLLTMARDGALCILQPPFRFNNVLKNYTDCIGMHYGFVLGRAEEGGFAIEIDRLQRLLERLERATAVSRAS